MLLTILQFLLATMVVLGGVYHTVNTVRVIAASDDDRRASSSWWTLMAFHGLAGLTISFLGAFWFISI